MKRIFVIAILAVSTTSLLAGQSSLKISHEECFKAKYAHTLGGTLHSRTILKKRLLQKTEKRTGHTRKESLKSLQNRYPNLNIETIKFIIRNCYGYYRFQNTLFDPKTLLIVEKGEL